MNRTSEPHDNHIYDWLWFNVDTFNFYLSAFKYYEGLLLEDKDAILEDKDLALLLTDGEKIGLEIFQELKQVARVKEWMEEIINTHGPEAWEYHTNLAHGTARFMKSVALVYLQHLKNRRNVLSTKPNISKYALKAVDQRISYFEEKTEIGVFKNASPYQLLISDFDLGHYVEQEDYLHKTKESRDEIRERPKPIIIDSIEILDPELKTRCLDLFRKFITDGQPERLDTVVSEATRILESKIRTASGATVDCVGVDLARFAFSGNNPKLKVSEILGEQEAAHLLFRGVFGYIRNSVHHDLVENLLPERVLQIIGMIDYLILVVEDANPNKENQSIS